MLNAQVIVVGGGPAGSSAAWQLARAGVDVLLLDRAAFPRSKPCAEYVSPEAARLLSDMGVLGAIDDAVGAGDSTALTGMTVVAPSGATIRGSFLSTHGFHGFRDAGIGCRREVLDALLLESARNAGVRVQERTKVESLLFGAAGDVHGVRARRADGSIADYRASLVIAADGLRSTIAHRLGLAHRAAWPNRLAIMAHYEHVGAMSSHGEMLVTRDDYFGLARVTRALVNVALVVPARTMAGGTMTPAARLDAYIAATPHLAERFRDARRVTPVRVTGPFASRARRAWAPGALLVGDAADFFDPFTGEGIYAALRGGELLAPHATDFLTATAAGRQSAARRALAAYDQSRRRVFAGKWRVEWLIGLAVSNPWLLERAARALSHDQELADLLVGVTGDFVPPSQVLTPRILLRLLAPGAEPRPSLHA